MDMEQVTRYHSVRLDKSRCKGCTNCLKHCPTEAIRVRGGRAHIIDERCIDCGECIRICDYHAKVAVTDDLSIIQGFPHAIAIPAPTLYGQFKNLKSISPVLDALKAIGFEEVFEVARGADIVSRAIHEKLREPGLPKPLISSACPAKMTVIRSPIGQEKSAVDGAISMMEIYGQLLPHVDRIIANPTPPSATYYGVRWATSSGEASAVCPDNSLSVDGIQNVIRVLEEIENNRLSDLVFFEGNACMGGCVGGPLTFENNYVAKNAIRKLSSTCPKEHPTENVPASMMTKYPLYFDKPINPHSVMKLDDNILVAMQKMEKMNNILEELPGYDCGSCGSPTCRTFAEDIVRGFCGEMDCIHKLKDQLKVMAQQMVELAQTKRE